MKRLLLPLLCILAYSCVDRNEYEVIRYQSKHLIDVYYTTQDIEITVDDNMIGCICDNFDYACCSNEFAKITNIQQSNSQQSAFSVLAAKNNDNCSWTVSTLLMKGHQPKPDEVGCNRALSKGISKIELESDADFDAEHPAGKSLMDIISLNIISYWKELSKTSGFERVMPSSSKPYNSFTKDELKVVGNGFGLIFSKTPTVAKTHNFTVTVTFDDGEVFTDTVEMKF